MNTGTSLRLRPADEARHIVDSVQQADYQHNIHIVAAKGIYDCDCSGFLEYVLSRVAPEHLKQIPVSPGETRPLAHDFAKFFRSLPFETAEGWRQIRYLHDAQRGDLIAWAVPTVKQKMGDTGHCFVVRERPEAHDPTTMAVKAYDSSGIAHYDDSRGPGPDQFQTGVGTGTFHLQINPAGTPVAFQFGPEDPVVADNTIAIARLERFGT